MSSCRCPIRVRKVQCATVPQPPPTAATPRINPYLPTAKPAPRSSFEAHPTWDGRGVTIGVVDLGITLDHPSLLVTSHRRKKGRGLGHGHRPVHGRRSDVAEHERAGFGRPVCLQRRHVHRAGGGQLIALRCSTSATRGSAAKSATTSTATAIPAGSSGIFAVLWNTTHNLVWVDTNQNNSFADRGCDDRLQGALRHRLLRRRQSRNRDRRADAVRRADRRQDQGRQYRHRVGCARLARRRYRQRSFVVRRRR